MVFKRCSTVPNAAGPCFVVFHVFSQAGFINSKSSTVQAELWSIIVPQFTLPDGSGFWAVLLCPPASQGLISHFSALLFLKTLFLACMYTQISKVLVTVSFHTLPLVCKKGGRSLGY